MVFHISTTITSRQHNRIPQDLIISTTGASVHNMGSGQPSTKLLDNQNKNDDYKKKMIHRDIEKQRRKEMATLYARLRSLIPLEYIKGKRATSDHMNGAIDYIKRLQMRITELGARRDDLKSSNLSAPADSISTTSGSSSNNNSTTSTSVVVHPYSAGGGLEIVLNSSSSNTSSMGSTTIGFPLSRVLQVLLGVEGLNLVSCATTKVNERVLLHTIQAEVTDDPTCINCAKLQEEIKEIISSWNKSS